MAMQNQNRAQYANLPPYETARHDRLIRRCLEQKPPMTAYQIMIRYRFTEGRIKAVAAKFGLAITPPRKNRAREKAHD